MSVTVYSQTKKGTEQKGKPGQFSFEYQGFGLANKDGSAPESEESVVSTGEKFELATVEDAISRFGLDVEDVISACVNAANMRARNAAAAAPKAAAKIAAASDTDKAKMRAKALALLAALEQAEA